MNNSDIKILIADDSAIQAEMLRRTLVSEGYSVIVAKDGADGLLQTKKYKPELVISDINMPVMNGFEFCSLIKSDMDISATPVILLTSLSAITDVIKALECGADNFIVKPYDKDHLLSRVKSIFINREIHENSDDQNGVEVNFAGHKYFITSEKKQILDLLISTYENAMEKNSELIKAREEMELLNEELKLRILKVQVLNDELTMRRQEAEDSKNLAEIATRSKSAFLANMSHELRTPLNSIIGFSEVLFDEAFGPVNEKQKKYISNVLISGRHLLQLINQILDMAKVESGKMTLTISRLSMKKILNEISMLVEDMISKKKLQMILEITEDLPDIDGDDLKIKEILYNLLSNAIKYTPEGGKIGIHVKKSDSVIEVEVWDSGIGIAPENMNKLFEGFFRVDTPYSRVTEGTGLGLPLSKKLVELHGGKFFIESEGLNKGTSVRFTLPVVSGKGV